MAKSNFYAVEIVTTDGPVVSRFFYGLGKSATGRLRPEQAAFRGQCEAAGVDHVVGDLTALMAWLIGHGYLRADQVSAERAGARPAREGR
jgi:hypothetical protein